MKKHDTTFGFGIAIGALILGIARIVIDSCVSNVLSSGWEDADATIRKPGGA